MDIEDFIKTFFRGPNIHEVVAAEISPEFRRRLEDTDIRKKQLEQDKELWLAKAKVLAAERELLWEEMLAYYQLDTTAASKARGWRITDDNKFIMQTENKGE